MITKEPIGLQTYCSQLIREGSFKKKLPYLALRAKEPKRPLAIHLCHQLKSVKEVGILPDDPPPPCWP